MNKINLLPHDLLFLDPCVNLPENAPVWVTDSIKSRLPCVVRRDSFSFERIPVGFRGRSRAERYGTFVPMVSVLRTVSPEAAAQLLAETSLHAPQLDYLKDFSCYVQSKDELRDNLQWGISGSFGFSLAVEKKFFRDDSDIDLIFRANKAEQLELLSLLHDWIVNSDFQIDVQVQTSRGGFSYKEWLKTKTVLLKTNKGPFLTDTPW